MKILLEGLRLASVPNDFLEQIVGKQVLSSPIPLDDIHEGALNVAPG
jgi:hypothetical protein